MPSETAFGGAKFKSKESYRKATAYVKIHKIPTGKPSQVNISGHLHKITHNDLPHVLLIVALGIIAAFAIWKFWPSNKNSATGAQATTGVGSGNAGTTAPITVDVSNTSAQSLAVPVSTESQTGQAVSSIMDLSTLGLSVTSLGIQKTPIGTSLLDALVSSNGAPIKSTAAAKVGTEAVKAV